MRYKRLERGRFRWPVPESGQTKVVLRPEELALLVGGLDPATSPRRAWFRRMVSEQREPGAPAKISA